MTRLELENKCDELYKTIVQLGVEWADAKVAYHNLKKLTTDLESKLMNKIELEQTVRGGEALPNVKLRRLTHELDEWREHREGLNAAYENEFRIRLRYQDLKAEYEITYMKYCKS